MRVLLTTDTIGGVWTYTAELAHGLLTAGHAVALVSFGRAPSLAQVDSMSNLARAFSAFNYTPSEIPLEWMEHNAAAWPEGERLLDRVITDFVPDLLHSGQFCFGRLSARLPVLVTAHSDVLSWAESTLALSGGIAQLERTTSPAWLSTYRQLVADGLAQATEIAAPTRWMAQRLAWIYDLPRIPRVIHNGVGFAAHATKLRKLQAVTAGRLWDQAKGLAILSEVEAPFPILVAGEHAVLAQATSLGALPHQELLEIFAESALYLATSVYEPFGLAPLEAARSGCAIVARDIPTFREVWGDAALYFRCSTSLEQLLHSLALNPRRLKAAQCRAGQRAARYTAQAMTAHYLELYERLLEPSTRAQEYVLSHA